MSFLGIGGAAAGTASVGGAATVGAVVVSGFTGAVIAGVIAVGGTQFAANVTQPDATKANTSNVNAPTYADE